MREEKKTVLAWPAKLILLEREVLQKFARFCSNFFMFLCFHVEKKEQIKPTPGFLFGLQIYDTSKVSTSYQYVEH